jgi:ABC-2 type transport system ATP-binding protein
VQQILEHSAYAIVANNLTRTFGEFVAVDNITFNVKRGEVFGFLGANGAGKTTAIRMLIGLLRVSSGMATVAGYDIRTQTEMVKRNIGYMSQKFSLYEDLTVIENFDLYGGIYGLSRQEIREKSIEALHRLDLEAQKNQLLGSLPLGWKQKLAFAVAQIHKPPIVFLDEPTGGVDPITRRQFWEMIYEAASTGTTMFVTTHYMDEAEYCDRISIMNFGKIEVMGTPAEIKQTMGADSINEAFIRIARPIGGAT